MNSAKQRFNSIQIQVTEVKRVGMIKTRNRHFSCLLAETLFFVLCLTMVISACAEPRQRQVTLTAKITIENRGDQALEKYIHKITIPVSDHAQQKLLTIRYPFDEAYKEKSHKRGTGKYLEFIWQIPPNTRFEREVSFDLLLSSYDIADTPLEKSPEPSSQYTKPSKYIESDAKAIRKLSKYIKRTFESDEDRLRAAYLFPQLSLKYEPQKTKGALSALQEGTGDCTEYAMLFIALARAMDYPARLTADFQFKDRNTFSQPNHHAAEVYLNGSWTPVDPNLALSSRHGYGFGTGGVTKIVLKRDTWVWSRWVPKEQKPYLKENVDIEMKWIIQ